MEQIRNLDQARKETIPQTLCVKLRMEPTTGQNLTVQCLQLLATHEAPANCNEKCA